MGKHPSEHFWDKNHHKYPFQVTVGHMSPEDIDPRLVQRKVAFHFLRVPFDGRAHWGFEQQSDLDAFKKITGLK